MDAFTRALKKNKKRTSLIVSLIFLILFILTFWKLGDEFSTSNWITFVCWYILLLQLIWVEPRDDFPMEIYFHPKWEKDIIVRVKEMGFKEILRNHKKIVFQKKRRRLFYYQIKIKKKRENLWKIGGRARFIKKLEKYRVQYSNRGFLNRRSLSIYLLIFTALSFSSFQCEEDPIFPSFDFNIKVDLSPEKKVYAIGDTLHLSFNIEDLILEDTFTKAKIYVENGLIPFNLYAGVRHSNINLQNTSKVFSWIQEGIPNDIISTTSNGQFLSMRFDLGCEYKEENYEVRIAIIPQKAGIYMLELGDFLDLQFGEEFDCNNYNDFYILAKLSYRFNIDNPNKDILALSPLPDNVFISGDDTEIKTSRKEMFWFKVE